MVKILNDNSINEEEKVNASLRLLRLGQYEGIDYFCRYVAKYNKMPYDYHFATQIKTTSFPYKKSLNLLFNTLVIPFQNRTNGKEDEHFERIDEGIYSLILIIALQSEIAYQYALKKYYEFYEKYEVKYKFVSHIFYPLNNLQNQYYINKEEQVGIEELLEISKTLKEEIVR